MKNGTHDTVQKTDRQGPNNLHAPHKKVSKIDVELLCHKKEYFTYVFVLA